MLRTCRTSIDHTRLICRPYIDFVNQSTIELRCVVRNNGTWRPLFPAVHLHTGTYHALISFQDDTPPDISPPGQNPRKTGSFFRGGFSPDQADVVLPLPDLKSDITRTKTRLTSPDKRPGRTKALGGQMVQSVGFCSRERGFMRCGALTYSFIARHVLLFVCLTGSGPGCPDLDDADRSSSSSSSSSSDVDIIYYYDTARGGELRANASCRHRGHVFRQPPPSFRQRQAGGDGAWTLQRSSVSIYCVGFVWSEAVPTRCVG